MKFSRFSAYVAIHSETNLLTAHIKPLGLLDHVTLVSVLTILALCLEMAQE